MVLGMKYIWDPVLEVHIIKNRLLRMCNKKVKTRPAETNQYENTKNTNLVWFLFPVFKIHFRKTKFEEVHLWNIVFWLYFSKWINKIVVWPLHTLTIDKFISRIIVNIFVYLPYWRSLKCLRYQLQLREQPFNTGVFARIWSATKQKLETPSHIHKKFNLVSSV